MLGAELGGAALPIAGLFLQDDPGPEFPWFGVGHGCSSPKSCGCAFLKISYTKLEYVGI